MLSVETVIAWFKAREGKVTYSMDYRNGPNSYDCSSAVFSALIEAGFLPRGTHLGSTETLYGLEGSLLQPISRNEVKRGDIFVSGPKGGSGGIYGHTGVFISNSRIIHCTAGLNGIGETAAAGWMGGPPNYFYRLKGSIDGGPGGGTGQKEGEIEMKCFYTVDGKAPVRYFDGERIVNLAHGDEQKILNDIYKANNNKDMPTFAFSSKAPYHTRLMGVLTRPANKDA